MNITIESDQHVCFVGKNGSGKSYAARYLSSGIDRLMVLDPKADIDPEAWGLEYADAGNRRALLAGKNARILVRASTLEDWRMWLQTAWDAGNLVVLVDELYVLNDFGRKPPPEELTRIYTMGRSREVTAWGLSQRPSWIPMFTLSECSWFFQFRLQLNDDRKRMAEMLGETALEPIPKADKFGCYVYETSWEEPVYIDRLQVVKKRKLVLV